MSVTILQGDCRDILPTIECGSVQTCVTSPPYFGLRDYGHGAQIGLEESPDAYCAALVAVFREVKRVLRDDGTLWLNIGDSYSGSWGNYSGQNRGHGSQRSISVGSLPAPAWDGREQERPAASRPLPGLKSKDLIGIPWMLAFALRADGWYLRSDIIWHKPNVMPESVTDRPTKAHEYLFLLTKAPRYYYDAEAIKEPASYFRPAGPNSRADNDRDPAHGTRKQDAVGSRTYTGFNDRWKDKPVDGRNKRSVWTVATSPYPGAHFATFPEALIEPCILAGSSPQACEVCGAPWERIVKTSNPSKSANTGVDMTGGAARTGNPQTSNGLHRNGGGVYSSAVTTGWQPTCTHDNAGTGRCVVIDPFFGSGTTGRVALKHGRQCIGIELSAAYIEQAEARTDGVQTMLLEVTP